MHGGCFDFFAFGVSQDSAAARIIAAVIAIKRIDVRMIGRSVGVDWAIGRRGHGLLLTAMSFRFI